MLAQTQLIKGTESKLTHNMLFQILSINYTSKAFSRQLNQIKTQRMRIVQIGLTSKEFQNHKKEKRRAQIQKIPLKMEMTMWMSLHSMKTRTYRS